MIEEIKEGMFIRFKPEWGDNLNKPWFRVSKIEGQKIILHDLSVIVEDHQKLEIWEPKEGDLVLVKTFEGHLIKEFKDEMKDWLIEPYFGPKPIIQDKVINKGLLYEVFLFIENSYLNNLGENFLEIKRCLNFGKYPSVEVIEAFIIDMENKNIKKMIIEHLELEDLNLLN